MYDTFHLVGLLYILYLSKWCISDIWLLTFQPSQTRITHIQSRGKLCSMEICIFSVGMSVRLTHPSNPPTSKRQFESS